MTGSGPMAYWQITSILPNGDFGPAFPLSQVASSAGVNGSPSWGPDGKLWFPVACGAPSCNGIVSMTSAGSFSHVYRLPDPNEGAEAITTGPDNALWYLAYAADNGSNGPQTVTVGRMATDGTVTGEWTVTPPGGAAAESGQAAAITVGPDGAIWFTFGYQTNAAPFSQAVGRIAVTSDHTLSVYPLGLNGKSVAIAPGPDGALWAPCNVNQICRITTSGTVTVAATLPSSAQVWVIAAGPDGAMWFTELGLYPAPGNLGRLSIAGGKFVLTEYTVVNSSLGGIAALDGKLWFTDGAVNGSPSGNNAIGTIQFDPSSRSRIRNVQMGSSVGNTPGGITGTAGLLVTRGGSNFILSANHVLGSQTTPADPENACPDTAVSGTTWTLQPGIADIGSDPGNDPLYHVGTVQDYWKLQPTVNEIDAAISKVDPKVAVDSNIIGLGQPSQIADPKLGEAVVKSGRTSGVTVGTIVGLKCRINLPDKGCGSHDFVDQIAIFPSAPGPFFAGNGDSGSAILDASNHQTVGLLMAGGSWLTIANKMSNIEKVLGVVPVVMEGAQNLSQSVDASAEDTQMMALEQIADRHAGEILALQGATVMCQTLSLSGTGLEFVVYGPHWTNALAAQLPSNLEGVPVRFVEIGDDFRFLATKP